MIDARSNNHRSILLHNGPFKMITCVITLAAFFINIFFYDLALLRPLGFVGQAWADSTPPVFKELNPNTFALPQSLGMIKDAWVPVQDDGSSPIVIQIQDAHCNYNAQKKIAEIIGYITDNYKIGAVNLEGGAKSYDLSVFTSIADKDIREKTADHFVKDGLVNGAEYFAANNPGKVTLWGIEDPALYIANLNVYRNFLPHKDETEAFLKSLGCILANLKIKIYSKELLEFDTKYSQYKADNLGFKEYLTYLLGEAKRKTIDVRPYRNLFLLSKAQRQELAIDFGKANNERDQLIDMLHKRLSKNAMEELVVKTVEFKAEKISQKSFYAYLVSKAKMAGIDREDLPEFAKYVAYISLYGAMDKMKVMEEIDVLEAKIKESYFENESQRELAHLSKNLAIMKNLFNISLTRDDYRYYKANEDSFAIRNFARFIEKEAPPSLRANEVSEAISESGIDRYREEISKFYEYSFKRDSAFVKNLVIAKPEGLKRSQIRTAILITGGFHTDNLCEIFRKEKISYISIIPNFKNDENYQSPYLGLLAGKERGIVNQMRAILTPVSNLQISSMMSDAMKAWGKADIDAFKAAVYIQNLIEQGKRIQITAKDGKPVGPILGEGTGEIETISIEDLSRRIKTGIAVPEIAMPGAPITAPPALEAKKALEEVILRVSKLESMSRDADNWVGRLIAETSLVTIYPKLFENGKISREKLESMLRDDDTDIGMIAAKALGVICPKLYEEGRITLKDLESMIGDKKWAVRIASVTSLGSIYPKLDPVDQKRILEKLESMLKNDSLVVQRAIAASLGVIYPKLYEKGEITLEELESMLTEGDWGARLAVASLGTIYPNLNLADQGRALDMFKSMLKDVRPDVCLAAAESIGMVYPKLNLAGRKTILEKFESMLAGDELDARLTAIFFGNIYPNLNPPDQGRILDILKSMLKDGRLNVCLAAVESLSVIYPKLYKEEKMIMGELESMLEEAGNWVVQMAAAKALIAIHSGLNVTKQKRITDIFESMLIAADSDGSRRAAATFLGSIYANQVIAALDSHAETLLKYPNDDLESIYLKLQASLSGLSEDAFVGELTDIKALFSEKNKALDASRRIDEAKFWEGSAPTIVALTDTMGKDAFPFLKSFLRTDPFSLNRFFEAVKLYDPDIIEALKSLYSSSKQKDPGSFQKILEIAMAYIDFKDTDIFISIIDKTAKDKMSLSETYNVLARRYLEDLAKSLDIDTSFVSAETFSKFYIPFIGRLKVAMDFLKSKHPDKVDLFKEVLKATFNGTFKEFMTDTAQENEEGKYLAIHNAKVREAIKESGVDPDKWLSYSHKEDFSFSDRNLRIDPENYIMDTSRLIANLYRLLPSERQRDFVEFLKKLGLQVSGDKDAKMPLVPIQKIASIQNRRQALVKIMSNTDSLKKLTGTVNYLDSKLKDSIDVQEAIGHLRSSITDLQKLISDPDVVKELAKKSRHFTIKMWERSPAHDLFLGDLTGCCMATNSRTHFEAMIDHLVDQGIQVAEIIDQDTDKTMALVWLFLAKDEQGKPYLVIDNMEISDDYSSIEPLKAKIKNSLIDYTIRYAQEIGVKTVLAGPFGYSKFKLVERDEGGVGDYIRKDEFKLDKIGGYYGSKYYLEALEKGRFEGHVIAEDISALSEQRPGQIKGDIEVPADLKTRQDLRDTIFRLSELESILNNIDPDIRLAAAEPFGAIYYSLTPAYQQKILKQLESMLESIDPNIRMVAATSIGIMYFKLNPTDQIRILEKLESMLKGDSFLVQQAIAKSLIAIYPKLYEERKIALEKLESMRAEISWALHRAVAISLVTIYRKLYEEIMVPEERKIALEKLESMLIDNDADVRLAAARSLSAIYPKLDLEDKDRIFNKLEPMLGNTNPDVCLPAAEFLSIIYSKRYEEKNITLEGLKSMLRDKKKWAVRIAAARFLSIIYPKLDSADQREILGEFKSMLEEVDPDVCQAAAGSISIIYPKLDSADQRWILDKFEFMLKDTNGWAVQLAAVTSLSVIYLDLNPTDRERIFGEFKAILIDAGADSTVRGAAATSLGSIYDHLNPIEQRRVIDIFKSTLKDINYIVRGAAATSLSALHASQITGTLNSYAEILSRYPDDDLVNIHLKLQAVSLNLPEDALTGELNSLKAFFAEKNNALEKSRRIDETRFWEGSAATIVMLADVMGKDAFPFLKGFLKTDPFRLNRFFEAVKLYDINTVETLKSLYSSAKQKDPGSFQKILEITMAYIDLGDSAALISIINEASKDKRSLSEAYRALAERYLVDLAKSLDIDVSSVKAETFSQFHLPFIGRLKVAMDFIKEKRSDKAELFKALLRATFNGTFKEFMTDTSKQDKGVALYNARVREEIEGSGVNLYEWLNYSHEENFSFSDRNLKIDPESYIKIMLRHMAKLYDSLPSEVKGPFSAAIKKINLKVSDAKNAEMRLEPYQKAASPKDKLRILKNILQKTDSIGRLVNIDKLISIVNYNDSKLKDNIEAQEAIGHLRSSIADLKENLENPGVIKELAKKKRDFTIKMWDRSPAHDLFLGDLTGCCMATNSGTHFDAMIDHLVDQGIQVVEIIDQDTAKTMALAWLFLAKNEQGKPYLVIDNMEINENYSNIEPLREGIKKALIDYAIRYAKKINVTTVLAGPFGYSKFNLVERDKDGVGDYIKESEFSLEKIGGYYGGEKYYLEALEKGHFEGYVIAEGITAVSSVTPVAIIETWKHTNPGKTENRLSLNLDTPSNVSKILNDILETKFISEPSLREIEGTPAILAKLCLIYEDSKPEDAEKNVRGWIGAYDKKIQFVAPTAKEIKRKQIDKLSWSSIFDYMDSAGAKPVRDRSSLSIIPFLRYAVVEGIHNIELPLDYMSFSPAVRLAGEYSDTELSKINAICEGHSIAISFHSPLIGPRNFKTQGKQLFEDAADNISMMREQIRNAGKWTAAKMMVVHLVDPKKTAEYAGLVLYAKENAPGLRVVFENYHDKNGVFPSAEDFMKDFAGIVSKVAEKDRDALNNIGIVLDAAHYNLTGNEDPVVSAFIIAKEVPVLAKQHKIAPKVWMGWLAELHMNENLGPIDCFGRKFSADIHSRASLEGPINNSGIIAMLLLMGQYPLVTLEQMELPDENDIGLMAAARALLKGRSLADVEGSGRAILEELQKVKDYKDFFGTQVADDARIDDAYRAYSILAGLIGKAEFEKHVQKRALQKVLTIHSEEQFNSVRADLERYGFMPVVIDDDGAKHSGITLERDEEGGKVIIAEGQVVNIDKDAKVLYFIFKGAAEIKKDGKIFEVKAGNFVGEMAVISDNHERTATVTLTPGTVVFAIAGPVIKDMCRLMPDFEELLKTYKGMREEADKAVAAIAPASTLDRMRRELLKRFEEFRLNIGEGNWVVKFDGPRIGATNDVYGREATDWFVDEIIKRTIIDFAYENGIPAEIGGKGSEEFTFCFPSALSEDGIRIKMDRLMQSLKEKCDQYRVITLSVKLDKSQIGKLKNAGAMFVYSVGVDGSKEVRTKIVFDKAIEYKIRDLLTVSGQAVESIEGLRVPYPVSAAAKVEVKGESGFTEASKIADTWQEQYKNTPVEDGGELLILEPLAVDTGKEKGVMPLTVESRDRGDIETTISGKALNLDSAHYAVEPIYGAYHRSSLGRLLAELHNAHPSKRAAGVHFIRGPPNEFYAIDVKPDGSFELVKFDALFFASNTEMKKEFSRILASGRAFFKIRNDNREMFGFKAINTIFGHDAGNFVIKAIRYSLDRAFKNRNASLKDKAAEAAKELNRIFSESGFGCFIMTSHITEEEAVNGNVYRDFVDLAITKVDDLLRARDVSISKEISSGAGTVNYIVKSYSAYKDQASAIADNLELAKYHKMIAGEDTIAGVDEDLAAKARDLHEAVSRIEAPSTALSDSERKTIIDMLKKRNWYYAKFSPADRELFNSEVLGGLRGGVQELIKDMVVKYLKANKKFMIQDKEIDKSLIKGIYLYGSWCYAPPDRMPTDLDVIVVVEGINENTPMETIAITDPDRWFVDRKRSVEKCDFKLLSAEEMLSDAPKDEVQLIEEASLLGHGIPIGGMDSIRILQLLKPPSKETLFMAVEDLLLAAELYTIAIDSSDKDNIVGAPNLIKSWSRWNEAFNVLSYLMMNYDELTVADKRVIEWLLNWRPEIQKTIEAKNLDETSNALKEIREALDAQLKLWHAVPELPASTLSYQGALAAKGAELETIAEPSLAPTAFALAAKGALETAAEPITPDAAITVSAPDEVKVIAESQIEAAKAVIADMSKGTTDIILLPGSEIYDGPQAAVDSNTARKFREEYGQDTVIYNYNYSESWTVDSLAADEALSRAISELDERLKGGDKTTRMIIFVPFNVIGELKKSLFETYPKIAETISVVGEEEIPKNGVVDTVMHVVLGKGLLNYERYKNEMTPESTNLLVNFIKTLVSNPEAIDLAKNKDVINNILNGLVPLRIKPIDFTEISEWKRREDAVLISL